MTQLLRCGNGHEWQVAPAEAAGAPVQLLCPVCGGLAQTLLTPPTLSHPQAPASEPPPPSVPGYEILEELGRGGMGIVYKAKQISRDRIVALKVIRQERMAHPDTVGRFRREAHAAARLSHSNIVGVYEYDQEGDTHYLAMEFVPGLTLQRIVEQSGALTVELACEVIRQTARALQHAAEQGLVHRDVKPSNLMLVGTAPSSPLPARPLVKVLDMGVARLYQVAGGPEESLTTLTRDGSVIGTPDYIAPEQLENPHHADVRADLYSLGCTFYFLLTARVPFPGGTLIQKLDRQRWETPPSVDQLRRDVPPAVAALVRRLMAKHPDDRPQTPADLVASLEHLARTGVLPSSCQPSALREVCCCLGHTGAVVAAAFSADGSAVVSGGADRTLRVWDTATGTEQARFGQTPQAIGCLAALPGTGYLVAGQGASIRIWDPKKGQEVQRLAGHTDAVRGICILPGGQRLLSGGDDRMLRLWDLSSGRELHRVAGHRAAVAGVALSPDGRFAASAGRDQTLRLWDVSRGREVRSFPVPRGHVLAVAFTADGTTILSAHFDTTLRLWDVETARELRRFSGHRQMVTGAVACGAYVASASHDQTVRVWDPGSGAEAAISNGHTGAVLALAASPDGRQLVSAGADGTVRVWELPR
jgi:WD40 repeat protein/tRNA A-37 threonylcarbamoyl transferase component Bud32